MNFDPGLLPARLGPIKVNGMWRDETMAGQPLPSGEVGALRVRGASLFAADAERQIAEIQATGSRQTIWRYCVILH